MSNARMTGDGDKGTGRAERRRAAGKAEFRMPNFECRTPNNSRTQETQRTTKRSSGQQAVSRWQTNAECGLGNAESGKRGIGKTRRTQQLKNSRDSRDEGGAGARDGLFDFLKRKICGNLRNLRMKKMRGSHPRVRASRMALTSERSGKSRSGENAASSSPRCCPVATATATAPQARAQSMSSGVSPMITM